MNTRSHYSGRLFVFLGPSGSGKDSIMRGLAESVTDTHLAQRVITRPADANSEAHESVSEAEFLAARLAARGRETTAEIILRSQCVSPLST